MLPATATFNKVAAASSILSAVLFTIICFSKPFFQIIAVK